MAAMAIASASKLPGFIALLCRRSIIPWPPVTIGGTIDATGGRSGCPVPVHNIRAFEWFRGAPA